MSGIEGNKIAGAVLLAGLIAMIVGSVTDILYSPEKNSEQRGYFIEGVDEEKAVAVVEEEPNIPVLLAAGNAEAGKKVAKKCTSCHALDKDGKHDTGPALWDIVGKNKAYFSDYEYSQALKEFGGEWDYESLFNFIRKPKSYIKGTKMGFAGLKKPQQIADLLVYLRSLSDSPVPFPEIEEEEASEATSSQGSISSPIWGISSAVAKETSWETPEDIAKLINEASEKKGKKKIKTCKSCHELKPEGRHKVGPRLWDIVGAKRARHEDFKYSKAMKDKDGVWTYEELYRFLEDPRGFIPDIKMTFTGYSKPEDRASVIRYLRTLSDDPVELPEK